MPEVREWREQLGRKKNNKISDYDLGNIDWLIHMVTENCWTNPAEYPSVKQQNAILREALVAIARTSETVGGGAVDMRVIAKQALRDTGGTDGRAEG